jgi:hypothetical protein
MVNSEENAFRTFPLNERLKYPSGFKKGIFNCLETPMFILNLSGEQLIYKLQLVK